MLNDQAKLYYTHFSKTDSRRVEEINNTKPSNYNIEKVKTSNATTNISKEEAIESYRNNDAYNAPAEPEGIKEESCNASYEEKHKIVVPVQSAHQAFENDINPGEHITANSEEMLGKRESPENYEEESAKKKIKTEENSFPFGELDPNKLKPKIDLDQNTVITPNTKEEEKNNYEFYHLMLQNLAIIHNMSKDAVLKFALEFPEDKFTFDHLHRELSKLNGKKLPLPPKKVRNPPVHIKSFR